MNYLTANLLFVLLFITSINCAKQNTKHDRARAIHDQLEMFGITDLLQQRLKDSGYDIKADLSHPAHPAEDRYILLCDAAVIGRVNVKMDVPAPEGEPFHSKAIIKVERVLKGNFIDSNNVEILLQGGTISDRDIYRMTTADPRIHLHEEAIFFLERPEHSSFLTSAYRKYFQIHGCAYPPNVFWLNGELRINDGLVCFNNLHPTKIKPLDEVVKNMQATLKMLED